MEYTFCHNKELDIVDLSTAGVVESRAGSDLPNSFVKSELGVTRTTAEELIERITELVLTFRVDSPAGVSPQDEGTLDEGTLDEGTLDEGTFNGGTFDRGTLDEGERHSTLECMERQSLNTFVVFLDLTMSNVVCCLNRS